MKKNTNRGASTAVLVLIGLLIVVIGASTFVIYRLLSDRQETVLQESRVSGAPIGYASNGVTITNENSTAELEEMFKSTGGIGISYENDAFSADGSIYACYIGNASYNEYDMYLAIYADAALTDQVFLSGLLRPGQAFDAIELSHPLPVGDNTVYVNLAQVDEENDEQVIVAQSMITMVFHHVEE